MNKYLVELTTEKRTKRIKIEAKSKNDILTAIINKYGFGIDSKLKDYKITLIREKAPLSEKKMVSGYYEVRKIVNFTMPLTDSEIEDLENSGDLFFELEKEVTGNVENYIDESFHIHNAGY